MLFYDSWIMGTNECLESGCVIFLAKGVSWCVFALARMCVYWYIRAVWVPWRVHVHLGNTDQKFIKMYIYFLGINATSAKGFYSHYLI